MTSASNCNLCLICGTNVFFGEDISLINSRQKICSKFLLLVSKYLNLNVQIGNQNFNNTGPVCCFTCVNNVREFCDTFQKLESFQLKLLLIVENISKLLATATNDQSEFQEKFAIKVKRKRLHRIPYLKLKKIICGNENTKREKSSVGKDEQETPRDSNAVDPSSTIVASTKVKVESIKQEISVSEGQDQIQGSCHSPINFDLKSESGSVDQNIFEEEGKHFFAEEMKIVTTNANLQDAAGEQKNSLNNNKKKIITPRKRLCKWTLLTRRNCLMCEKIFPKPYLLEEHMRLHTNERPFSCRICDKSYPSKAQLKHHRISHLTISSVICHTCGIGFANEDRLKRHRLTHNDGNGRKFACEICHKAFKRNTHLRRHKLFVHVKARKEKPYECKICGVKFVTKWNIQTHMKRKHGNDRNNKIFKCPFSPCAYADYSNAALVNHLRFHILYSPTINIASNTRRVLVLRILKFQSDALAFIY